MGYCTNCGHELGVGRFCTNCGQPIAQEPPAARYPLFADEVEPAPDPEPVLAPEPSRHRSPRPWWPWVAVVVALVLVVVLVLVALDLTAGEDEQDPAGPSSAPAASERPGGPGDPTRGARVAVPATAPPNQDVAGNRTTYVGANLLDGSPETCWRMPGDGTGAEITVTLARETHLTGVGIVNGYAKTAQDAQGRELDWYHGNRRVLAVEWVFDDGTTVQQELADTVETQSVEVDVTTTTVVLRLLSVSEPGTGPAARDYTAISELALTR